VTVFELQGIAQIHQLVSPKGFADRLVQRLRRDLLLGLEGDALRLGALPQQRSEEDRDQGEIEQMPAKAHSASS
jgi:hypothetical protein